MSSLARSAVAGERGTGGRIIKVNHAGEFGAVNIYRAQIFVARLTAPNVVPLLEEFIEHERRHLATFGEYLASRGIRRCRSYLFCGIGGYVLGFITALLGKPGIMACTAAVETVVTAHLVHQLEQLRAEGDHAAVSAVESIVADELEHREVGVVEGRNSLLYKPLGAIVSAATSAVIWLGMKL